MTSATTRLKAPQVNDPRNLTEPHGTRHTHSTSLFTLLMRGRCFPPCREPSFRALYLDDSILASVVRLDFDCVPLLPTLGPHSKFDRCGLGIPGSWFQLEHRLREIDRNVKSIGMVVNTKKTTLMLFNNTRSRQCLPFCSLADGDF